MVSTPTLLAGLWIIVMLIYLLGDVLRIFSKDFDGKIDGKEITKPMWLGISILMVIPIIMIFLSLTLDYSPNRIVNIVVAIFFFLFNLVGLPTYPSAYDRFLLVVSMVFNVLTVYYVLNWN